MSGNPTHDPDNVLPDKEPSRDLYLGLALDPLPLLDAFSERVIVQDRHHNVVWANAAAAASSGLPQAELVGRRCYELWQGRRQPCQDCPVAGALAMGESTQVEMTTPDGNVWLVRGLAVRDSGGKIAGAMEVCLDITPQRRSEAALRRSEDKHTTIVDMLNDGVVLIENGLVKFANSKMAQMTGFRLDEALGKPFVDFVAPPYRELVTEAYRRRMAGLPGPDRYEIDIITRSGASTPVEISASAATIDGAPADVAVVRDVTQRKRLEEGLRRGAEMQTVTNSLLRLAQDDISMEELLKHGLELFLSIGLPGFQQRGAIFLVEDDPSVLVMKAHQGMAPALLQACAQVPLGVCHCGKAALGEGVYCSHRLDDGHEITYEGISPHGHLCVPIRHGGRLLGVMNAYLDEGCEGIERERGFVVGVADALAGVIVRKQGEEKLRRERHLVDRIIASTPNALAVLDSDQRVVLANRAFRDMFGPPGKGIEGLPLAEIVPIKDLVGTVAEVAGTAKPRFDLELKFGQRLFTAFVMPMRRNEKEAPEVLVRISDVTVERASQEQLYHTARLASVGELAAGLAHEVNNPMASVLGYAELLLRAGLPEQTRQDVQVIHESAQQVIAIVKNLLTFARKQTPEKKLVELNEVVVKVLAMRGHQMAIRNIQVVQQLAEGLPPVMADPLQLQQVFLNIVMNAEQAMLEAHKRGALTVSTACEGEMVRASFSDDGPGIPPEHLRRIFDPFFTTKPEGTGTGLGLSICYGIVSEHGGRIWAESPPGQGAAFFVELPAATSPA